jgi:8-amino-7-oxononanoate synthase
LVRILRLSRFSTFADRLAGLRQRGLYRRRRIIGGAQGREVSVEGRTLLNFCSNDYLGLAADARLREAFTTAAARWGVGSGASHLVCGHSRAHHDLEEAVALFTGRPRALVFSSGYAANLGAIAALVGPGERVFEDRLNHASLIDGGRLSGARFGWYRHADAADLAAQLRAGGLDRSRDPNEDQYEDQNENNDEGKNKRRTLVVSDGVFSMDGDCCPLAELVVAARAHDAWLMVDDAHGIGVLGRNGCGLVDPTIHGTADVPVLVGTFGKAFGTAGAFVAGDEDLIELLIQRARTYIYTTAMPAAVAAATLVSLQIVRTEEERRERLRELVARFRAGATQLGLPLTASQSPIQPLIVGDAGSAVALSAALETQGILVSAIRPPTVPVGTARLRVTFSAAHLPADVDRLLASLDDARRTQQLWS